MFQLLPCSRCQRTFSVRSEVSDGALLKCPNCGNQFRLGELLDAFYAPWQILENPGTSSTGTAATGGQLSATYQPAALPSAGVALAGSAIESSGPVVSESATSAASEPEAPGLSLDGPDLELVEDKEDTGAGLALGSAGKEKPKTDWSNFKPITHEEYQRLKRADRSPIWSTLQVVLGGAAAIPVSLLLIWHVLDKDVAGAGPAVARYAPWIVPKKFHGSQPIEPAEPITETQRVPRRGESGFRNFDDVMPLPDNGQADSSSSVESNDVTARGETVVGTLANEGGQAEVTGTEPDQDSAQSLSPDASLAESPGPADSSLADVFVLLRQTKEKVDGWKEVATAQDSVKRAAALSLFDDLASLGVHLSSLPDTSGAPALARDRVQEISRAIKRQPDLTEVLHNAAKAQLNGNLPRSKNGWVLVCTVGEMLDEGDAWRIMVADPTLLPLAVPTIEIPKSVAPQLTSGQRLLLLGKFIVPAAADASVAQSKPNDGSSTETSEPAAPGPEVFRASFSYGL